MEIQTIKTLPWDYELDMAKFFYKNGIWHIMKNDRILGHSVFCVSLCASITWFSLHYTEYNKNLSNETLLKIKKSGNICKKCLKVIEEQNKCLKFYNRKNSNIRFYIFDK